MTTTLAPMDLTTTHRTDHSCIPAEGDTISSRWPDVTCASCLDQMPRTPGNGCAHDRMILVCLIGDTDVEKWSCPCGHGERRLARA